MSRVDTDEEPWVAPMDAVADALQDLYEGLDSDKHVEDYLNRLCLHAIELVPDAEMASVTALSRRGAPYTVAQTSKAVEEIDRLQYSAGSGPCLDAARMQEIVAAGSPAALRRWPEFALQAQRYGVTSFLSVPLPELRPGIQGGSVNLYSTQDDGFRELHASLMNLFTTAAGYAIMSAERYRDARTFAQQLEQALDSRATIDQAKGVLMALHSIDADDAFRMLAATSQRTNRKVREIADELLHRLFI